MYPLPRPTGGSLGLRRVIAGFVVALTVGPLLTGLLFMVRSPESITSDVLAYQLLVVVVALVGGIWPALFAAVLSGLTLDYLFVAPQFSIAISDPRHLWALLLYVAGALLVSWTVDQAARRANAAERASAEAAILADVAGHVLRGESAVPALVSRTRDAFGLSGTRLIAPDDTIIATDGEPVRDERFTAVEVGTRGTLELHGRPLDATERRLLDVIVTQLEGALERADLAQAARAADALAATDQVRSALLNAVSHDVRRPLAAAVASVGGLRSTEGRLSDADRAELLATADESLQTLTRLVTDLLDVSRVEAGVLAVSLRPVDVADAVLSAVDELGAGPDTLELDLDAPVPALHADGVLLQRVLVNVISNALQHAPAHTPVRVSAVQAQQSAEIRVIDHGPGLPADRRSDMFAPFQRLNDADNTTGLGLGLALSRGFTVGMGGTLTAEDTPGGGLTMIITLPLAFPATEATS